MFIPRYQFQQLLGADLGLIHKPEINLVSFFLSIVPAVPAFPASGGHSETGFPPARILPEAVHHFLP